MARQPGSSQQTAKTVTVKQAGGMLDIKHNEHSQKSHSSDYRPQTDDRKPFLRLVYCQQRTMAAGLMRSLPNTHGACISLTYDSRGYMRQKKPFVHAFLSLA
jgi:hypothetical protein